MKSVFLCCALGLAGVLPALAEGEADRAMPGAFAPIAPEALTLGVQALEALVDHPGAPAVVLRRHGTLRLASGAERTTSTLDVEIRIKVLTEAGRGFGQVTLSHGQGLALVAFEGRTVRADGSVAMVPDDTVFRQDQAGSRAATNIAFPAVEIGAIIDYRYRLAWGAPVFPDPWYFDERIPTLESTFVYEEPAGLELAHHLRETGRGHYQVTTEALAPRGAADGSGLAGSASTGRRIRIRLENVPAVADEPFGFPFGDLAHCVWVVTEGIATANGRVPIAEDWRARAANLDARYRSARRFDRDARQMVRKLLDPPRDDRRRRAGAEVGALGALAPDDGVSPNGEMQAGEPGAPDRAGQATSSKAKRRGGKSRAVRTKVEAIYRFVRETIKHAKGPLGVGEGVTVDQILLAGQGTSSEIALVLVAMLEAIDVPARLVWAADWRDGMPSTDVVRLGWFSKALVETEVDGQVLYLDASDRRLGFGRLSPVQEGTEAIVLDQPPRRVTLPKTPAEDSTRQVDVSLALDDAGRLRGSGRLSLRGHHAWFFLRRRDSAEAVAEGWRQWLADHFPGFDVETPMVDEQVDAAHVTISWTMAQNPADVLGDESSLLPSLPWGPLEQRYALSPAARTTPVRVSFADRDELVLDLSWPPGWQPEVVPDTLAWPERAVANGRELDSEAPGHAHARVEIDPAARSLRYERVVQIDGTVIQPGDAYQALRNLYAAVERHDAQPLVLLLEP